MAAVTARSEPLLWLQLLSLGAFPLEALVILLLLAGNDPGPWPGLERVLCWAIGVLAPTLLLWQRPADVWSLLLVQTPLRARRDLQQRLSRLQEQRGLELGLLIGALLGLPLLWWLDRSAAIASPYALLQNSPRLVALLLAAGVLTVMIWQWQQLLQSLWLLCQRAETIAATEPLPKSSLEQQRLSLGLPLLLPGPLQLAEKPEPASPEPSLAVAIEPEQPSEQHEGDDLDEQIGG